MYQIHQRMFTSPCIDIYDHQRNESIIATTVVNIAEDTALFSSRGTAFLNFKRYGLLTRTIVAVQKL